MEQPVVPFYFQNKHNTIALVVSSMLFIGMFFLVFSPFQSRAWVNNDWQFLAYSLVVAIVAGVVIGISRINLYHYNKKHKVSYLLYAIWILLEIVVLTLVYTLGILFLFTKFAQEYDLTFFKLFKDIFVGASFLLLIPYTFMFLFFRLKYLQEQNSILQTSSSALGEDRDRRFNFYDEKGELKMSIKQDNILYILAADNYVEVYYESFDQIEKMLIRNSLKNMAISFYNTSLIRCHRSYIVNMRKVSVMKKIRGEAVLQMADKRIPPIPISPHYAEQVTKELTKMQ